MDDNTVDKLFNMLLLDPLPTFTKKEMAKYIGPNNLHKYDPVRLQLTTLLMKQHSDNRKERELTKPILVKEGRLILNDCSVHSFDYEERRVNALGEQDWHQHDQWACAYAQLSNVFESAKEDLSKLEGDIEDWHHSDECDASNCYSDESGLSCDCPFKEELLVDGEIPDDHDYSISDKIHTECTCGLGKLQSTVASILSRMGFVR